MPVFGNLGTMLVRDKDGKMVPVPVIRGEDGTTPHIGENNNWFFGDVDTGIPASGRKGDKGDTGEKGEKGDPFVYSDFTPEQLLALKGDKGDTGDVGETGPKGDKGDTGERGEPFVYEDFTPEQLAALKGEKGDTGPIGPKGDTGTADLTLGIKNAKVGQIILVKEVDAAGVPVTWETADMDPSHIGGAGETEIQTISEHNMYRHILSGEYYGSVESGWSVSLETDENEAEINAYAIGVIIQEMEQITDIAAIYVKFEGMNEYIKMCTLPFLKAASILITPQIYWGCEIIPFSESDTWKKVMSVLPYNNQKITGVKVTGVEKIDIELWEILQ